MATTGRIIEPSGALITPASYAALREPVRVLTADPPWQFGDNLPGKTRGASRRYYTMDHQGILALPLPPIAKTAILFLWRVASMQAEGLEVVDTWGHDPWCPKHHRSRAVQTLADMRTWAIKGCPCGNGFTVKTDWSWQKLTKTGKPWFGMGRISRASKEIVIVATRGNFTPARRDLRDTFEAKVPVDEQGDYIHSAKPDRFYELVEQLTGSQGPYCDLFARRTRPGWMTVGNECAPANVPLPARPPEARSRYYV